MIYNDKSIVEVTDEGVLYVDYLLVDHEYLLHSIINKSCHIHFATIGAYLKLTLDMLDFLKDNKLIEQYKEVSNFISNEFKSSV